MLFTIASPIKGINVPNVGEKQLASFCLELFGGGLTTTQTSKAMQLVAKLRTLPEDSWINESGYTITKQPLVNSRTTQE